MFLCPLRLLCWESRRKYLVSFSLFWMEPFWSTHRNLDLPLGHIQIVLIVDVHALQGVLGGCGIAAPIAPGEEHHGEATCVKSVEGR